MKPAFRDRCVRSSIVTAPGRSPGVDFEFAPLPLVVEVSGRRGHVSEVDRGRDAQRRNELQADGFVVIEFLTADVINGPDSVVASVRGHIARVTAKTNA